MESLDFRAPPPSPVDSSRLPSLPNDGGDIFSEFLTTSLRVPNLTLSANKLFQQRTPPKLDFHALLRSDEHQHERRVLRDLVSDSFATIGCFQLLNHGIPPDLITSAAEAAVGIFQVPQEKRAVAMKSPEKACGFEECDAEELSEEFVWLRDHNFNLKMERIWPIGYSNFSEKMDTLVSMIEKVAEKILAVVIEDYYFPKNCANSDDQIGTVCCVYKHKGGEWAKCLKYGMISMLIRGTVYPHSLCLHVCDASSEFHVYSNKSCFSFLPEEGAIIVTAGDQTQHVTARPVFKGDKQDNISMAFLSSPISSSNINFQTNRERTISLGHQIMFAIILNLVCHVLIYLYQLF